MCKRLFLVLICLMAAQGLMAQTFSVVNADGVSINYSVLSSNTCKLLSGSYTGALIVPDNVEYGGTAYTVTEVDANCFRKNGRANQPSQITYLCLPSTLEHLGNTCFWEASFDSVRFLSDNPPSVTRNQNPFPAEAAEYPIFVPCGRLARYHAFTTFNNGQPVDNGWCRAFSQLRSDCAVPVIGVSTSPTCTIHQDGWYEIGDTALLTYSASNTQMHILGWSNNCFEQNNQFIVTGPDTITLYADAPVTAILYGNNIATTVTPFGMMGYNLHNTTFFNPANAGTGTIFNSTIWATGETYGDSATDGQIHAAAQKYTPNYLPGPLRVTDGSTSIEMAQKFNRVWVLDRSTIDDFIAHVGEPGYQIPEAILTWPCEGDTTQGYASNLAIYYDANLDGRYRPQHGDYPIILGDRCAYVIFNDLPAASILGCDPMGIEVHAMYYLFDEPADTALSNTVFAEFLVFNRSSKGYLARFSSWIDFDIGYPYDDFVGCDVEHNMFYGYNGNDIDGPGNGAYDGVPPAQGCIMLDVIGQYCDERHPMGVFMYYNNSSSRISGDPVSATDFYRYAEGTWLNGQSLLYGGDGISNGTSDIPCHYMFPGDSDPDFIGTDGVAVEPWTEVTAGNAPNDRRGVASTDYFYLNAHSTGYRFLLAYTTAFGSTDAASSVDLLRHSYAPHIQQLYRDRVISTGYWPDSPAHEFGIDDRPAPARVTLFPNPARQSVTLAGLAAGTTVQIYNMQGSLVMTAPYNGSSLSVAQLPAGIYLLSTPAGRFKLCKH